MFESLQDKFQQAFKTLRGRGTLTPDAIDETLRDVRMALLEADVNFNVVKTLVERVRVRAIGEEIGATFTPAQEVVRIVRDELVEILGHDASLLTFSKEYPSVLLMVGLQGSGKTTSSGKLALWLSKRKKRPMLVSTDVYRPAAREQLAVIAKEIGIPCFAGEGIDAPVELALEARKDAADRGHDAGRVGRADHADVEQAAGARPHGLAVVRVDRRAGEDYRPGAGLMNRHEERYRLQGDLDSTLAQIQRLEQLLGGPFARKAPAEVVQKERDKLAGYLETKQKLEAQLMLLE